MLKFVGAVVVVILLVVGAAACIIWALSPKVRTTTWQEIERWRGSENPSTRKTPK